MSDTKKPFMKFYPADWRAEKRLRLISRAARSLWIDILGLIHEEGTGRLEVDGRPMTVKELADMLGDNPRTTRKLLAEIEEKGVSSRDENGFITSRRIIRDLKKSERDKLNGRMGGNPALKIREKEEMGVNPPDKAHIPEARDQIGGGGSARAREPDKPPKPSPELREKVLAAMGHDPTGITASGKIVCNPTEMIEVRNWISQLGLSEAEVVEVIEATKCRDGPPSTPKYYTDAMRRHAGAKNKPELEAVEGGRNGRPTSKSAQRTSAFLAGARGSS